MTVCSPGWTSADTFCRRWTANVCWISPLFTIVNTTVPTGTFFADRTNRYSYILSGPGVTAGAPGAGGVASIAQAAARQSPAAARIANLRKDEGIDDVTVAGSSLLVAVAAPAALEHGDVLLAVRLVRDPGSTDR